MHRQLLLLCCLFLHPSLFAQYFSAEKDLIAKIDHAVSDSAKIKALGDLAEFYYIYRAERKGDSVLNNQLLLAELSTHKNLILDALFGNAINYIGNWTSIETFDKALRFLDKGLSYAQEINKPDYEVLAYIRKAAILKKRGQFDNAIQQATMAFSSIDQAKNDSLKAVLFLTLGDIYLAQGEAVQAYKNFNNAYDIAYDLENISLQSEVFHNYATLYQTLGNATVAKAYLYKSLELNMAYGSRRGLLADYIDLARLTDEVPYIKKAILLADSLKLRQYQLFGKKLMFAYLIYVQKNSAQALSYLHAHEDLKQSYINTGSANYYWNIGNIYFYSNQPDSALKYYRIAEPGMQKSFDLTILRSMYREIGECYLQLNQTTTAITYFEKALAVGKEVKNMAVHADLTLKLSSLYARLSDYQNAYLYNQQYVILNDSLNKTAAQRDVVLLEVDRENMKHEKDLQSMAAETLRVRNLQYMGISLAIAAVFFVMVIMGMFPVSKVAIKMFSFFAFICLFEFIVLLIDSYLHQLTHGEPLKIWLIKIFLIALLVPVQHFLEHAMVRFLQSRKLMKLREQFAAHKIWKPAKKPTAPQDEVGFEQDTAVL